MDLHSGSSRTVRPRTLWIVCPVYYDVDSFIVLRTAIRHELAQERLRLPEFVRFVVIDDTGAQDRSLERLHEMPDVEVIFAPFNLGHQRALVFGLRAIAPRMDARDWVVTLDADGEDRPSDLGRMLAPLSQTGHDNYVVLARRTKRHESLWFKALYLGFKVVFRVLTGTLIRTGNYAAFHGLIAKQLLFHPAFDVSYASALLSLNVPAVFVPCERGTRYSDRSKMGFSRLIMHGLRMLMPFIDRIAARAMIAFGVLFMTGLAASVVVGGIRLFTAVMIPVWTLPALLFVLAVSLSALGNFLILFVVFAQSGGLSLRGLHDYSVDVRGVRSRDTSATTGWTETSL